MNKELGGAKTTDSHLSQIYGQLTFYRSRMLEETSEIWQFIENTISVLRRNKFNE